MTERRAPLIALAVLAVIAVATAIVLLWISSNWQYQANTFYNSNGGIQLAEEEYEAINRLSYAAYQLGVVADPLLAGGAVAALALLAVLAFRWERRPAAPQADALEATAAS